MISSDTSSRHRTHMLDGPCDTSQLSEGLQGTPPAITLRLSNRPYLHPWVQNILRGTESSTTAGLGVSSTVTTSLLQATSLGTFYSMELQTTCRYPFMEDEKRKSSITLQMFASFTFPFLLDIGVPIKHKPPQVP